MKKIIAIALSATMTVGLRKVKFQDNADNNCEVIIGNYVFDGCVNLEEVELSKISAK